MSKSFVMVTDCFVSSGHPRQVDNTVSSSVFGQIVHPTTDISNTDWVSEFAPPNVQKFLSYIVGWLTFTGWQSAITAIGSIVAGTIQGLIALKNPDYVWERWHTTLLTIAVVAFCVFINIFVARRLPLVEGFLALVHFAGLFIVIIVLWTLAPRNNAHDAFFQFSNNGGYASDGVSFMVGILPLTLCLLGFDSQVHMAEETEDSARSIPRTIMYSTYINAFLGFLMVITLIFTWGDMAEISDSLYGWPFLTVFYNATGSKAATIAMTMLVLFPLTGSVIACVATASRQTWAFARDNGVPFSATVRHVRKRHHQCQLR
jgi:amino acid transporter